MCEGVCVRVCVCVCVRVSVCVRVCVLVCEGVGVDWMVTPSQSRMWGCIIASAVLHVCPCVLLYRCPGSWWSRSCSLGVVRV